ncbi:MAG: hypothetical protein N2167_00130 [Flavobacteriales bacterium]|nr:hypothetical protein [Flavobacteriales bacterium]
MKASNFFIISFAVILIVIVAACGKSLSKEEKEAKILEKQINEVMAIHDSVMPKTGEIFKLKKKLSNFEKTISDSIQIQKIFRCKNLLVEADEAMMKWMHEFREADPMLSFQEKQRYYLEEKKKITEVKNKMLSSIDSAKFLLHELENISK